MYGAVVVNNETMYVQEGRLGYEEYAAKGFQLWGFHTERASKPEPYDLMNIYGIDIPYDQVVMHQAPVEEAAAAAK